MSLDVACSANPARGQPNRAPLRPAAGRGAWLVPDVSLVASFATLFYCLTLFNGVQKLFRDSDSGWHIRTGESILAGGALPRSDPYSFTRSGQPWFAWEWGSDVLMGAAHRLGGLPGVVLLYALAIAAGVWLWFRLHWASGGNFFLACALAAPMLSTANLHWHARPHVLSWLLLLAAVWYAERLSAGSRWHRHSWLWVSLCTALWANLHASFFFAPAIALLYAAAHFARPLIWDLDAAGNASEAVKECPPPSGQQDRRPGACATSAASQSCGAGPRPALAFFHSFSGINAAAERRKARWFLWAAASALLGSLLNPYGWNLHRHVLGYLADRELLARVGEFQSFNFHAQGAFQILLALGVAALGAVLALGQRKLAQFLLSVALIGMALRSARGLPMVALLLLPLANGAITQALRGSRNLQPRLRRVLDRFLDYSDRLRGLEVALDGRVWASAVVLISLGWLTLPAVAARTGFPPDQFPTAAAAAIEKLPEGIRLLAPDKYGGYLIYRFQGKRKVFCDGRSDFYGAGFMQQYIRLMQVRPGWRAQLDTMGFTHALLPNDYSLLEALEQLGWKRLYRDSVATLLEKPSAQPGKADG